MVATAAGDVVSLDENGSELARAKIAGVRELVQAGTTQQVVAQPALLADRHAAASLLATLLGKTASEIETRLSSEADTVLLGVPPSASARTSLDDAIADGTLTGVNIQSLPQIAALTGAGLTFLVPSNLSVSQELAITGATGAAYVTGLDAPRIYVAAGGKAPIVRRSQTTRTRRQGAYIESHDDPAGDASTSRVRPLHEIRPSSSAGRRTARRPRSTSIETARQCHLCRRPAPVRPGGLGGRRPAATTRARTGRTCSCSAPTGATATVDIGNNPFAWRLPGVILGALTAGLLYLLARILFRRRSVAIFVGDPRARRRHGLRPVADRHERRLRRLLHRRRLHALRGAVDRADAAWRMGVLGARCR